MYLEVINQNNLDSVYKSAIASKASYQLIAINLDNLSSNYLNIINDFISYINDEEDSYVIEVVLLQEPMLAEFKKSSACLFSQLRTEPLTISWVIVNTASFCRIFTQPNLTDLQDDQ